MEKERRIKALGIVALVIAVLGLTIAFAALSQTLTINGSAYLDAAKWGIKFQNLTEPEKVGDANTTGTAVIEEDVSINNINVSLSTPGDSVTYGVELVNEGTINAKIEKIDKPELTNEQQRYLKFTVKDDLGNELVEGDILNAGETKHLTIKIEFKKDIEKEDLPTSVSNITLSYKLNFVQTDDKKTTTSAVVNNCTNFTKKDTYNVGDVIALCNEQTGVSEDFYVMKDNGDTVTALAKYNLLVGNTVVFNDDFSETTSVAPISSTTEEYGLQSSKTENVIFDTETELPITHTFTGIINFANLDESRRLSNCTGSYGSCFYGYWIDVNTHKLLSKYGSSYPVDVYDSNSNLYEPAQNYVKYLKTELNKASVSVRIPTKNELVDLGCNSRSCASAPSWVYSVNYWTASANDNNLVWGVLSSKSRLSLTYSFQFDFGIVTMRGLRPVITISKTEL